MNKFKIMRNTTANDNNNLMISLTRSNDDEIALFFGPWMLFVLDWCVQRILMSITNGRPKTPHYMFSIAMSTVHSPQRSLKIIIIFSINWWFFIQSLFYLNNVKSDIDWRKIRQVDCIEYEWHCDMGTLIDTILIDAKMHTLRKMWIDSRNFDYYYYHKPLFLWINY